MSFITYFEKAVPTVLDGTKNLTVEIRVDNEVIHLFVGQNSVELDWKTADEFRLCFEQAMDRRFKVDQGK